MRCTQKKLVAKRKTAGKNFGENTTGRWEGNVEADMSDHSSPSSPSSSRAFDGFTHITLNTSYAFPSLPPFSILRHSHNMPLNYSKWDMLEVSHFRFN